MRIENAINEIRGHQKSEVRSQETQKKRPAGKGASFDLSPAAKTLNTSSADQVRQDRIEQTKQRTRNGFYNQPEVLKAIADAIIHSGAVDQVVEETRSIRSVTEKLGEVPDLRDNKVVEVRERVERGFYDLPVIREQIADKVGTALTG